MGPFSGTGPFLYISRSRPGTQIKYRGTHMYLKILGNMLGRCWDSDRAGPSCQLVVAFTPDPIAPHSRTHNPTIKPVGASGAGALPW